MTQESPQQPEVELVNGAPGSQTKEEEAPSEALHHPAKAMRIGAMVRQLLEEVRGAPLDEASRTRLREIYESSIAELSDILSPELREEMERLSLPFADDQVPSEAELRVAHAQLVGWLEGLFHGIQATLFAQQMEMRSQLEEMRRRSLPPGQGGPGAPESGPGQYL
jgi:Protein of unknown function (DUF2587)